MILFRPVFINFDSFWAICDPLLASVTHYWPFLACFGPFLALFGSLGPIFGSFWPFGPFIGVFEGGEAILDPFKTWFYQFGPVSGPLGPIFGLFWTIFGPFLAILA